METAFRKPLAIFAFALGLLCCAAMVAAQRPPAGKGYRYFEIGDVQAKRPGATQAGLMLVGGGDWPYDAFRWMIERAGHGRIVILRASGTTESQDEFFKDIGGITAAQTIVFSDRRAASDPKVLEIVRNADGIFLAGGDQSNYVNFWKGTPLNRALDAHVRAGKPIGGTSAGLAVLGAWSYGAMDGGSVVSETALKNPMSSEVTLVGDFLHMPYLQNVITDSHFGKRERLGRLIAFVARLSKEQGRTDIAGIGVDEYTALCIDNNGVGRVFTGNGGYAWLVRPQRQADEFGAGRLTFRGVPVTGIGKDSLLRLPGFQVEKPAFTRTYDVQAGRLTRSGRTASLE
ncbi:peptidase [Luteimonas gilva]|uniref:Peptidase n=1 Tax=Luteimonas gilva TaxID=2572684 RepID=A0A4U5K0A5_9GAMM|nr:cyanophycinase [Luteimonas gilva]TKR34007.1 peptidase [Luteimonas gilva]